MIKLSLWGFGADEAKRKHKKAAVKGRVGHLEVLHLSEACMGCPQGLVLGRAVCVVEWVWALKCSHQIAELLLTGFVGKQVEKGRTMITLGNRMPLHQRRIGDLLERRKRMPAQTIPVR